MSPLQSTTTDWGKFSNATAFSSQQQGYAGGPPGAPGSQSTAVPSYSTAYSAANPNANNAGGGGGGGGPRGEATGKPPRRSASPQPEPNRREQPRREHHHHR